VSSVARGTGLFGLMSRPDDAVPSSIAGPGDVADDPEHLTFVTVRDANDEHDGFLIQWRSREWIFADKGSYTDLSHHL